jgi:uncharacterized protein (TIGR01777 family)
LSDKRVAVTGAHGMIGRALVPRLRDAGWEVIALSRGKGPVLWNPDGDWDASPLEGVEAVIHLAGESVAGKWTADRKRRIRDSRARGTASLVRGIMSLKARPAVLVSASAVGLYGNRGHQLLSEGSEPGSGFLAEVVRAWEAALDPAASIGIRVVRLRLGVVLSSDDGALARMLTPFRLGTGGPIGGGRQYMSWVDLDDAARAFMFALDHLAAGAYNLVAPTPVTNSEFVRALGEALNRPAVVPLPALAVRLMFGQMGEEVLLYSQRASSKKLVDAGFAFEWPTLPLALAHELDG